MSINSEKNVISNNTPLTTALALALCAGAFWTGKTTEGLNVKVDNNRNEIIRLNEKAEEEYQDTKSWRNETIKAMRAIEDSIKESSN